MNVVPTPQPGKQTISQIRTPEHGCINSISIKECPGKRHSTDPSFSYPRRVKLKTIIPHPLNLDARKVLRATNYHRTTTSPIPTVASCSIFPDIATAYAFRIEGTGNACQLGGGIVFRVTILQSGMNVYSLLVHLASK